jgi:very-short-patch-repair endonuclease
MSDAGISRGLARGRLHPLHRGVFAVGHRLVGRPGLWMAAVLASGPGARLSHWSAGALWDVGRERGVRIDVTLPGNGGRRRRAGLTIHRARDLRPDEVDVRHGIPVTSPARTLLDLAAILDERALERALDRAELLQLTDYPTLDALARARSGHHGAGKLRRALASHEAGTTLTKSALEELFLALCRRHGLPQPLVNTWLEAKEVDFLFPRHRLIVETDSWTYHRSREAFETDRARDALMARAGYRTLRFTYRQIEREPASVAQTVAMALSAAAVWPAADS